MQRLYALYAVLAPASWCNMSGAAHLPRPLHHLHETPHSRVELTDWLLVAVVGSLQWGCGPRGQALVQGVGSWQCKADTNGWQAKKTTVET